MRLQRAEQGATCAYGRRLPGNYKDASVSIVWFRGHDLRVEDNPALYAAVERGCGILPVFIWDEECFGEWKLGNMAKWWLFSSLKCLCKQLEKRGIRLVLLKGNSEEILVSLVRKLTANAIFWNKGYDIISQQLDKKVIDRLNALQVEISIHEEDALSNRLQGNQDNHSKYLVENFSSWMNSNSSFRNLQLVGKPDIIPKPILSAIDSLDAIRWEDLEIEEEVSTRMNFVGWRPGCVAAKYALKQYAKSYLTAYNGNNSPTYILSRSKLSPHIRFGEITCRQAYCEMRKISQNISIENHSWILGKLFTKSFFRNSFHVHLQTRSTFMECLSNFPFKFEKYIYEMFIQGQTGYPIVDAAIRALRFSGWIHMSLRYLLFQFFVLYLMLPWKIGCYWFYSHCIDAELSTNLILSENPLESLLKNSLGKVIDISAASRRIDPFGNFIKRWVSELSTLDSKFIHSPWKANKVYLDSCNIQLGISYPFPIVYPRLSRRRAKETLGFLQALLSLERRGRTLEDGNVAGSDRTKRGRSCESNDTTEWESTKCRKTRTHVQVVHAKNDQGNGLYPDKTANQACNAPNVRRCSLNRETLDCLSPVMKNTYHHSSYVYSSSVASPWWSVFDEWNNSEERISPHVLSPSPEFLDSVFHYDHARSSCHLLNAEKPDFPNILWSPHKNFISKSRKGRNMEYSLLSIDVTLPQQHPIYSYQPVEERSDSFVNSSFVHSTSQSGFQSSEQQSNVSSIKSVQHPKSGRRDISLEEKRVVLESIAKDSSSVFHMFARFISENYDLTNCSSRPDSKDFIRLRNIRHEYDRWKPRYVKLLKLAEMKQFFSAFLNLDVSDERDRHYHGGIRGPYVYGIQQKIT